MHAGLEKKRGVEEQLTYLRARDTSIPKVEALSGRKNVWDLPEVNLSLSDTEIHSHIVWSQFKGAFFVLKYKVELTSLLCMFPY